MKDAERLYTGMLKVYRRIETYWPAFLAAFRERFGQVASRDPQFQKMMQELLRGEDFSQPSIDSWYRGFRDDRSYSWAGKVTITPIFRLKINQTRQEEDRLKIHMLVEGEEWIDRFLSTMYECYQKVSLRGQGDVFTRIMSVEDKIEAVQFIHGKIALTIKLHSRNFIAKATEALMRGYKELSFDIPLDARFEHIDICAGSGHGKTWLLQSFIADILNKGYGFAVMDSQGVLIQKILILKPLLQREVIYVNPEDREYIPGINFFGANLDGVEDKEKVYNTLISFYQNIFSDLMGSGLTEKQTVMFGYMAQLLLTIPKATIFTFIDVLTNGEKYRARMQSLPETPRYFFENHFFLSSYGHTKDEISRKLLGLVQMPTIDRILRNTEQRIDFLKAMNEGAIILINTSKEYLQETLSAFFGKYLFGMFYNNVMRRSPHGTDKPFFLFIDEAQEYFLESMGTMFSQFRKFNVGLTIAHQNLSQLKKKGIDADVRASTGVKIVGSPNKEDASVLAAEMRTDMDFLRNCKKYKEQGYSEWACFIRHDMDKAIKIKAPWFALDAFPKLTKEEQELLLKRNRDKYCVKAGENSTPSRKDVGQERDSSYDERSESNKPKSDKPSRDDNYFL